MCRRITNRTNEPMSRNKHRRKWYQFSLSQGKNPAIARQKGEYHTRGNDRPKPTPQAMAENDGKPLPPESRLFVRDQMSDYERLLLLTAYVKQLKHQLTEARIMGGGKVMDWKSIAKDVHNYIDGTDEAARSATPEQLAHALHQALKRNHKDQMKLHRRVALLERELSQRGVDPLTIEDEKPDRRHEGLAA